MISRSSKQLCKALFSQKKTDYHLPHPKWSTQELNEIVIDHKQPLNMGDRFAHFFIQSMRMGFDVMSGYRRVFPW